MLAEIIAIGSELTSGAKLDTNSQWLSLQLAEIGIPVLFHTTVADDLDANIAAVQIASERVELILLTGGLGPTLDDLTRQVIAGMMGVELVEDVLSMDQLESFFTSRGREMPQRNRIQAMFPEGSIPLINPVGTAPGIWAEVQRDGKSNCFIAAMPGVPSEMKKMFLEQVKPKLPGGDLVIRRARINCYGIGESATEEILGELTARGSDPEVGITAHEATITLRINATGKSEEECFEKIGVASRVINEKLAEYVFGTEDEELEDVVVHELISRGQTFATIEHATAGLLAQRIAHVTDSNECYRGGRVAISYADSLEEEASRLLKEVQVDYVIAVGPEAIRTNEAGRLISEIPLLLISEELKVDELLNWTGNPAITKSRAAKSAINLLHKTLREPSSSI